MKKIISITLIASICLVIFSYQAAAFQSGFTPAVSKLTFEQESTPEVEVEDEQGPNNNSKHPGRKYNFKGEVVSFDGSVLEIAGKRGGIVLVDDATEIKITRPEDGITGIQVGQQAMAKAVKVGDSFLAIRVMIFPSKPGHIHRVGVVTDYQPGVSITILGKGSTTFMIAPEVEILPLERADQLKVGSRVTIISPAEGASEGPIAMGIVIHPDKSTGKP